MNFEKKSFQCIKAWKYFRYAAKDPAGNIVKLELRHEIDRLIEKSEQKTKKQGKQPSDDKTVIYQKIATFKQILGRANEQITGKNKADAIKEYAKPKGLYVSIADSDDLTIDAKKFLYEKITLVYNAIKKLVEDTKQ